MKRSKNYDNYRFIIHEYNAPRIIDWSEGHPWHTISYVMEGEGLLKADNVSIELKKGDLYYIPMGLSYKCHWKNSYTRLRTMGFRIFYDGDDAPFAPQKLPPEFVPQHREIPLQVQPDAQTLGKFYTLLGQLVPIMERQGMDPSQRLVKKAKNLMSARFLRWSVSAIAEQCGVSESTLYLAFKNAEGRTPNQVRHEIAMNEAIRLLTDTNNSISKISDYIGFSSDTYFRKIFKEHTGKSPRQVRKEGL